MFKSAVAYVDFQIIYFFYGRMDSSLDGLKFAYKANLSRGIVAFAAVMFIYFSSSLYEQSVEGLRHLFFMLGFFLLLFDAASLAPVLRSCVWSPALSDRASRYNSKNKRLSSLSFFVLVLALNLLYRWDVLNLIFLFVVAVDFLVAYSLSTACIKYDEENR